MRPGRNDPCPCGSGRKYKKCCLGKDESAARTQPPEAAGDARQRALQALERWAFRPEQDRARHAAALAFCSGQDPHDVLDEADADRLFPYACFDYVHEGTTLAESFLASPSGHRLDADAREALLRLAAARLRIYQIREVAVDEGIDLEDLLTSERVFVTERRATHQLVRGDLLGARVARFDDGRRELEGGLYLFPPSLKRPLRATLLRAERELLGGRPAAAADDAFWRAVAPLIQAFWLDRVVAAPPPKLTTPEGDPLELGRIVFDVVDGAALKAALDAHRRLHAHPGGWTWAEPADGFDRTLASLGFEGDRLVAEVTSRARGERVRRLVERAAGPAVRFRSSRFRSAAKLMAKPPGPRRDAPEPGPEAFAYVEAVKDKHYRAWPDDPLPALGGLTAREAARSPFRRSEVVDLLVGMENMEARMARSGQPAYDFSWLWRELGLERPR